MSFLGKSSDKGYHIRLQRSSAGYNNADANGAFRMKALKIFQVAIKERIFIVPLNFQCNDALIESPNVIYLMRHRFALDAVDCLFDLKIYLLPSVLRQSAAKTLCPLGFAATPTDNFFNWNGKTFKNGA